MNRDEITRIFRNPPYIETRRLVLRKMQKNDAADMYEYASRSDVTRYLLWEPHESESYTQIPFLYSVEIPRRRLF